MLWLENWLFRLLASWREGEVERKICWSKRNLFPVMQFAALFLPLFPSVSCAPSLVWASAKSCIKALDAHAAFSTLWYLYLPREAFLYGPGNQNCSCNILNYFSSWGSWDLPKSALQTSLDWLVEMLCNNWKSASPTLLSVCVLVRSIRKCAVDH